MASARGGMLRSVGTRGASGDASNRHSRDHFCTPERIKIWTRSGRGLCRNAAGHSQSRRRAEALCRTRTGDPFLTMGARGCDARARTHTQGWRFQAFGAAADVGLIAAVSANELTGGRGMDLPQWSVGARREAASRMAIPSSPFQPGGARSTAGGRVVAPGQRIVPLGPGERAAGDVAGVPRPRGRADVPAVGGSRGR